MTHEHSCSTARHRKFSEEQQVCWSFILAQATEKLDFGIKKTVRYRKHTHDLVWYRSKGRNVLRGKPWGPLGGPPRTVGGGSLSPSSSPSSSSSSSSSSVFWSSYSILLSLLSSALFYSSLLEQQPTNS